MRLGCKVAAMRGSISGFGALAGILALMGCGSAPEKDYRREANAICAAAQKRLEEIPKPTSSKELVRVTEREVAVREEVIKQLGELPPPIKFAGGANAVFKDLEARQERAHALIKAVEEKHEKELRKIEEEERVEAPLEAARAEAAGLRDCAHL